MRSAELIKTINVASVATSLFVVIILYQSSTVAPVAQLLE
jgi:hypothetical protein